MTPTTKAGRALLPDIWKRQGRWKVSDKGWWSQPTPMESIGSVVADRFALLRRVEDKAAEAEALRAALEGLEVLANEWRDQAEAIESATHTSAGKPLPKVRTRIAAESLRGCADELDEAVAALATPAPAAPAEPTLRSLIGRARANHVRWEHEGAMLEECTRTLCIGAKMLLWPDPEDPSFQPAPAAPTEPGCSTCLGQDETCRECGGAPAPADPEPRP